MDCDGRPLPQFPTQKTRDLFYCLILSRDRMLPRDVLVGTFWGDFPETVARKHFRTTLWRLRATLGNGYCGIAVHTVQGQVRLHVGPDCWVDIDEFEDALVMATAPDTPREHAISHLDRAIALYRGDLLQGVYRDWCAAMQDRLRTLYLHALERRMTHAADARDWPTAIALAQRLLALDLLREHVHRDLMVYLYCNGDRPKAIQQYHTLERQLDEELGVPPMGRTRAVYDAIRADDLPDAPAMHEPRATPTYVEARMRAGRFDGR
jgi:DNA-binding SARP family transcriptional activator